MYNRTVAEGTGQEGEGNGQTTAQARLECTRTHSLHARQAAITSSHRQLHIGSLLPLVAAAVWMPTTDCFDPSYWMEPSTSAGSASNPHWQQAEEETGHAGELPCICCISVSACQCWWAWQYRWACPPRAQYNELYAEGVWGWTAVD